MRVLLIYIIIVMSIATLITIIEEKRISKDGLMFIVNAPWFLLLCISLYLWLWIDECKTRLLFLLMILALLFVLG